MEAKNQTLGTFYASNAGQTCLRHAVSLIAELWPDMENKRVLTIGYATPFYMYFQTRRPSSVTEIEFEGGADKTLSLKTSENSFPFKNETFDFVFAAAVLERVSFPNAFLSETRRVLKSDGSFVLMTLNRHAPWNVYKNSAFGAGRLYSGSEVKNLLESNLFRTEKQKSCVYFPPEAYDKSPVCAILERQLEKQPFLNGAFVLTKTRRINALEESFPVSVGVGKRKLSFSAPCKRTENGD